MKILIVSQYFWPEFFIINDLVKILVQQGHNIKVLTGKPNYPDGKIFDGYESRGCVEEKYISEVNIFRVPLYPRGRGGAKNLILNYLSFVFNGLRYFPKAVKNESYDVIFVFAISPITAVIPAIYLKWKLKSHLSVWVQDLWPESVAATGLVSNRFILYQIGLLVRVIYSCTDTLLIQSRAFKSAMLRYTKENKIIYFPNMYNPKMVLEQSTNIPVELLEELSNNFCIVFAGNIGKAQSVETFVKLAQYLQRLPKFRLVLVGSGSMLEWLKHQKQEKKLNNIILANRFPEAEMSQFYSRAAGLLVTLKRNKIFSYIIPSKIQAYLAAGKPIIAALDGEGANVIKEAGAGFTCAAEDEEALAECIEKLYYMSAAERDAMGSAGRAYFLEHFNMETQSYKLISIFKDRLNIDKE